MQLIFELLFIVIGFFVVLATAPIFGEWLVIQSDKRAIRARKRHRNNPMSTTFKPLKEYKK